MCCSFVRLARFIAKFMELMEPSAPKASAAVGLGKNNSGLSCHQMLIVLVRKPSAKLANR